MKSLNNIEEYVFLKIDISMSTTVHKEFLFDQSNFHRYSDNKFEQSAQMERIFQSVNSSSYDENNVWHKYLNFQVNNQYDSMISIDERIVEFPSDKKTQFQ